MITLRDTDTEFLLFIPASQKERARRIQGRTWDSTRRCWVYPRSQRVWNQLQAEFGDELTVAVRLRREPLINEGSPSSDTIRQSAIEQPDSRLRTSDLDTNPFLALIKQRDDELKQLNEEVFDLKAEIRNLSAEKASKEEMGNNRPVLDAVENMVTVVFGRNADVQEVIKDIQIDNLIPFKLGKLVESHLKAAVNAYTDITFNDLIWQAGESGAISEDAVDYAHFLRRQRNKVAHGAPLPAYGRKGLDEDGFLLARNLLCTLAAGLLLRELPS